MVHPLLQSKSCIRPCICAIFELHRVMKSPECLVTKHVLQGVPEVRDFARSLLFATKIILHEGALR